MANTRACGAARCRSPPRARPSARPETVALARTRTQRRAAWCVVSPAQWTPVLKREAGSDTVGLSCGRSINWPGLSARESGRVPRRPIGPAADSGPRRPRLLFQSPDACRCAKAEPWPSKRRRTPRHHRVRRFRVAESPLTPASGQSPPRCRAPTALARAIWPAWSCWPEGEKWKVDESEKVEEVASLLRTLRRFSRQSNAWAGARIPMRIVRKRPRSASTDAGSNCDPEYRWSSTSATAAARAGDRRARSSRVERVGHVHDARIERDVVAEETEGIPLAVGPFVMELNDREVWLEERHLAQDSCAESRWASDLSNSSADSAPAFAECDRRRRSFRCREEARPADDVHFGLGERELAADEQRQRADPSEWPAVYGSRASAPPRAPEWRRDTPTAFRLRQP